MSNKNRKMRTFDVLASSTDMNQSNVADIEQNKLPQLEDEIIVPKVDRKERKKLSGCQQVCLIIFLSVLVIFFMIFLAVALDYIFAQDMHMKKNQQKVDSQTQTSSKLKDVNSLGEESIKYDSEIQRLTSKVNELQKQIKSQKSQIIELKQVIQNKFALVDLIIKNLNAQKQLNITKPPINSNFISKDKEIIFKVRDQMRQKIPQKTQPGDRYDFGLSIDSIIYQSNLKMLYPNDSIKWSGIKKAEYQRAIRLLEVVHNVNFKGEFVFDHFNFYNSAEDKAKALLKILQQEKQYFDKMYEINKYSQDQIGICVYVPSYNNAKNRLYLRNLDSIFQQEYQNYHLVYINDASTDGTGDYVKMYMEENGIPAQKYVIINNQKNKGNCANVYNAGNNYCKEGEIMVFLDGDDALIGRQVFSLLNAVYQKEKIALTYGQFLLVRQNLVSNGFSRYIPDNNLIDGNFRSLKSFYTSHLKTMYVDVFRQIKVTDLQYDNGTFYDYASDVVYMTPAIELVGTRLKFLTQVNYEYRFDTGLNEQHFGQMQVEAQIYLKTPLTKMSNMSFADNPKTVHYP